MLHELLVVHDTEIHLSILRKIGAQAGFKTTGVNSAEGAATILRRRSFDCITLDLQLGEQSGMEVVKLLATQNCTAPILIISACEENACNQCFCLVCSLGL